MKFKAFNLTAQGASHIKKNKECQDASKSFCCEDYGIAIVCDGHGGEDYIRSAIGSEKASQIALDNIKEFIVQVDKEYLKRHFDSLLYSLQGSIISMWRSQIRNHWEHNPITQEEKNILSEKAKKRYLINDSIASAYGTTLLAVVVTKNYWFCFQIGDGRCVWVNKDSNFNQLKLDDRCFFNSTTSLCDSDALEHFHNYYSEDIPAAVFVGSDGIDDCFKNDQQLYSFYKTMCYSFGTTDIYKAVAELEEFLPRLSKKGSGDDVSIASILNMDLLPNIDVVISFNREDERAKKQKSEEEEAKRNAVLREEYQRKMKKMHKKLGENKCKSEENLSKQIALSVEQQAVDDELKITKVIQDLDIARRALADAKRKLEKAEEVKNIYLQKLQNTTDDNNNLITQTNYKELCKAFQEKNDDYMKYIYEHQNALGKFNEAKIVHDSVIRSIGAKCPNPKCNEINIASAKFCTKCGSAMSTESTNVEIQEKDFVEDNGLALDEEKSCMKEGDESTINISDDITIKQGYNYFDKSAEQVVLSDSMSVLVNNKAENESSKDNTIKN